LERQIGTGLTALYFKESNMYIDWQLSDVCNFGCAYCNFESKGGIYGWPSLEQTQTLVDNIIAYSNHKYRTYNLLGGEPTLWKHFGNLCEYIHQHDTNSVIQVLTNGSRTIRWWKKYSAIIDKIVISHHVSTQDLADHTISVAKTCYSNSNVSIQLLMDINNFEKCTQHFDLMIDQLPGISITPKKGETNLGSGEWMPYSQDQLNWLDDALQRSKINSSRKALQQQNYKPKYRRELYASDGNTEWKSSNKDLIINDQNHFLGWQCNIGRDIIAVKSSGEICPASACFKDVTLGNYRKSPVIDWPSALFICKYNSCFCGADIEVEKHAIN
jgi:organic radical activating enzyme